MDKFIQAIHEDSAGIVLFDVHAKNMGWAAQAIKACEEEGVEGWLSTDFVGTQIARAQFEEVMNRNLLIFRSTRAGTWQSLIKILFDRVSSACFLMIPAHFFWSSGWQSSWSPLARRFSPNGGAVVTETRSPCISSAPCIQMQK